MQSKIRYCFLLFIYFSGITFSFAQISVSANQTAQALAQKLAGKGVVISNPTLNCPTLANGLFTVTGGNIGLDSGIVLTNGVAATQNGFIGVNGASALLADNNDNGTGDASLVSLLFPGQTIATYDACDLEFDLVPNGDIIKFNYVFSSEEYKNAVCGTFNDVFAFIISGGGISGQQNMALVPGTDIPVAINSINDGAPSGTYNIATCNNMGPGSPFSAYYIDNSQGSILTHQGFTTVLTAAHAVAPCNMYHLKIEIVDAGDPDYDSGVFLKAGSLQAASYSIQALAIAAADTTFPYCVKGCLPGTFFIKRTQAMGTSQVIKFITGGTAVSGIDYSPIADSVIIPANDTIAAITVNGLPTPLNGPQNLVLYLQSPVACVGGQYAIIDSASLTIYDSLQLNIQTPDTSICGNDPISIQVTCNDTGLLYYSWSPATGLSNANVKDPVVNPHTNTTYTLTASLPGTSCPSKNAQISFIIKPTPGVEILSDSSVCVNDSLPLNITATPANPNYSYSWSGPGSFTSPLPDPVIYNITQQTSGIYTITVTNDTNNCKGIATVDVNVFAPLPPVVTSPVIFCENSPGMGITAQGQGLLWYSSLTDSGNATAPIPNTGAITSYQYYVSQVVNNCISPKASINVVIAKCCDGIIFIPDAFTPNNDGKNDIFEIRTDYGYTIESFNVYNRWGQLVFQSNNGINAWDGTFGGRPSDIGSYYYEVLLGCMNGGEILKRGVVTLIR